jgi:hypothetical protein
MFEVCGPSTASVMPFTGGPPSREVGATEGGAYDEVDVLSAIEREDPG